MRYRDITRLPASHPILAEITIDPADWFRLEQLDAGNPGTQIIGHDGSQSGRMIVRIACASDEVKRHLEDGWG
jgi:hypothetical protein